MALVPATSRSGTNGTNGSSVLNGSGAPGAGLGANGDFYIDTTAEAIYGPKAAGAWGSGTSLVGPAGAGFAIGSSRLTAPAAAGQTGKAMGSPWDILWGAPTIVGSDLAIVVAPGNSAVEAVTAGSYEFVVQVGVISATGTLLTLHSSLSSDPRASTAIDATVQEAYLWATTGPIEMAATDQITFDVQADNAAETGTFDVDATTTFLRATRLA